MLGFIWHTYNGLEIVFGNTSQKLLPSTSEKVISMSTAMWNVECRCKTCEYLDEINWKIISATFQN